MATTKKRINVTLSPDLNEALSQLAKRDRVPEAAKAAELLRLGMEVDEDLLLTQVADQRLSTRKRLLSHEEVWKR